MATLASSYGPGEIEAALDRFVAATRDNRRNAYPLNAFVPGRSVFPQEAMYRDVMNDALAEHRWDRLQNASPVRVFLAYVRPGAPFSRSVVGALRKYRRRSLAGVLHGDEELPSGFETETVTLQDVATRAEAVDTVLTSSATWPVTRLPRIGGKTYIDGGAIDGLPIRALSPEAQSGRVIVLLADDHPSLPNSANRLYLAPEEPPCVSLWDYASPEKVVATYEAGQAAGKARNAEIRAFLGSTD